MADGLHQRRGNDARPQTARRELTRKAPLVVCYSALVASQSIPWIAKEAGFFDRQGLNVRLVYIASSSRSMATLWN